MNTCTNKKHKFYTGVRKPRTNCVACYSFYLHKNKSKPATLGDLAEIFDILAGLHQDAEDAARGAASAAAAALYVANKGR